MTNSVTMTATCLNGKPLEALERLVAQRQRELGETTSEAVIATAINALSSIRALTKVCDPKKAAGFVSVAPYPALVPSFRRVGAKRFLCLRPPGKVTKEDRKNHVEVSFINAAGKPHKGWLETVKVFVAQDRRSESVKGTAKRYYIIARNLDEARAAAGSRRIKRIERYAGMAKWTIGQAQSQIAQKGVAGEAVTSAAKQIGVKELQVAVHEQGWGNGSVSVSVADNLRYAALALKGGPGDVDIALMRAANRTAGILNAHHKKFHPFDSEAPIPTPFPEVKGRR